MKCGRCGYDDHGTGDAAHFCQPVQANPTTCTQQIAEAVIEAAAKKCDQKFALRVASGHPREASAARSLAGEIRALDIDAIIASVPRENAPEASEWHRLIVSLGCMFGFDTSGSAEEIGKVAADLLATRQAQPLSDQNARFAIEVPAIRNAWKAGNEYAPYHPCASHVSPEYRDGWNACYQAAKRDALTQVQDSALQTFIDRAKAAQGDQHKKWRELDYNFNAERCGLHTFHIDAFNAGLELAADWHLLVIWLGSMFDFDTIGSVDEIAKSAADRLAARQAQPLSDQNARFAIEGAIEYGKRGINPPPTSDHWLMQFWEIGKQLAAPQARELTDAVTLECVQTIAHNYFHYDENDELICSGCSGLYVDGNCNHQPGCIAPKARALLSANKWEKS